MKKKIFNLILILVLVATILAAIDFYLYKKRYVTSDAAFIRSNRLSFLAFKVDGKVIKLFKDENEKVKKGELLAKIDIKDFLVAKEKATFEKDALDKEIDSLQITRDRIKRAINLKIELSSTKIDSLKFKIDSLKYKIEELNHKYKLALKDENRYKKLLRDNLISQKIFEDISLKSKILDLEKRSLIKSLNSAQKGLKEAKIALKIAKNDLKKVKELSLKIEELSKKKSALLKVIEKIDNYISYSTLKAPFSGIIAKKFYDAPIVIPKGKPIYALVDPKELYCEVLLSERKLSKIDIGSLVIISPEGIEKKLKGEVVSIAPTSAATFSLVPRDIASGEFTKLDQRFKVKIKLKEFDPHLRVGMSASVEIERKR